MNDQRDTPRYVCTSSWPLQYVMDLDSRAYGDEFHRWRTRHVIRHSYGTSPSNVSSEWIIKRYVTIARVSRRYTIRWLCSETKKNSGTYMRSKSSKSTAELPTYIENGNDRRCRQKCLLKVLNYTSHKLIRIADTRTWTETFL